MIAGIFATVDATTDNYFNSNEFKESSASEKMLELWKAVTATQSKSGSWPGIKQIGIFVESMAPTFEQRGDVFEEGFLDGHRQKYIHSVGRIAKAKFVPVQNQYTGIWADGCDNLLVRLSSAVEPKKG